jgi:hypothetical protein
VWKAEAMSGRFQPEAGADSPEQRRYYDVVLEERYGDERIKRRIGAYGPRDLNNLVRDMFPDWSLVDQQDTGLTA